MPKKLYKYTRYKQDGTIEVLPPREKMTGDELREEVGGWIELVNPDYYPENAKWGHCTVYCDEEGQYKEGYVKNPHFRDFGNAGMGMQWAIVGNAIKEEVYHGE